MSGTKSFTAQRWTLVPTTSVSVTKPRHRHSVQVGSSGHQIAEFECEWGASYETLREAVEAYLENDSQANWDALAALVSDKVP